MTVEQIRNHIESDMKVWKSKKSELWKIKDQKWNGTKKSWNELNAVYSHKIQTLEDILIYIDTNQDDQYWCKHPDENGNKIPMTKVKGSRVMSKEEVKELNKVKLPF
jgi:hypothetical protein